MTQRQTTRDDLPANALPPELRDLPCRPRLTALLLMLTDLFGLTCGTGAAVYGYLAIRGQYEPSLYLRLWPCLLLFILAYDLVGLYHGVALYPGAGLGPAEELRRGSIATTACFLLLAWATFLSKTSAHYSRAVFLLAWGLSLVLLPLLRAAVRAAWARCPWWGCPCVIFGCGETAGRTLRILRRHPEYGLNPVAMIHLSDTEESHLDDSIPVIHRKEAVKLLADNGVTYAIAVLCEGTRDALVRFVHGPGRHFQHILVVPPEFGHSGIWASARCIETILGLEIRQNLLFRFPRFCRRTMDLTIVLLSAPIILPAIAILAVAVRLTSPGPVFYSQIRIGRHGRPFRMWKFRTMREDADQALAAHLADDPAARGEWEDRRKLRRDPRITPFGAWLRRLSLDEMPQFINVFLGHMGIVGPRPIVESEIEKYGDGYDLYQRVRPGLTGLWQVSGRNNLPFDERVALDAFYVRNWSVWLDLYIMLRTIPAVLSGTGAY